MKKRLFDFTPFMAVVAILAYGLLITLFAVTATIAEKPTIFIVVCALLVVSFLFILWYFVLLAAKLTPAGVRQGSKKIKYKNLQYSVAYDPRMKENVITFTDAKIRYEKLDRKQTRKKIIKVQATASNIRKLSQYVGQEIELPVKTRKRNRQK